MLCLSAFFPARRIFFQARPSLVRCYFTRVRAVATAFAFAILLSPISSAQAQRLEPDLGTLSPAELLLDPARLEAGDGGITERWQAIRTFLRKGLQNFERGEAQVSMTKALLQAKGWQEAKEFSQSIDEPVWRARALLSIASSQFSTRNGRDFGLVNLEEAFSILRSIPTRQLDKNGEESFKIVGELFARQGFFKRVIGYLQKEKHVRERTSFLEGALPYLSANAEGLISEERDNFINELLIEAVNQSKVEDLFRLSDYSIRSGRTKASNRLLFEAYRRALLLPPGDERNQTLMQVASYMLSNGSFKDALRAIRRIESPYLQSNLLAETGRRMIQSKMEYAGQPLLSLSNDIARTLEPEQKRKSLLRLAIEYALSGDYEVAWEVLQEVEDDYERARGVLALAFVLSESGDIERALSVQPFIPDANLRARLVTHTARQIAERFGPQGLTNLLLELLEADDFSQPQGESTLSAQNVEALLEAQLDFGNGRSNDIIFERAQERALSSEQSAFSRLQSELRFLRIDARRSERRASEAQRRIEILLRNMWVYHNEPGYLDIVESAVEFFITRNDLTRAFTIAKSLTKGRELNRAIANTKHDGLLEMIAFQATRRANEDLALRAVASIKQPKVKRRTLARVIDIAANLP